jgi:hypothetical protein
MPFKSLLGIFYVLEYEVQHFQSLPRIIAHHGSLCKFPFLAVENIRAGAYRAQVKFGWTDTKIYP